ncbi:MAG: transposase [Thermoanaerobaculia bacterium]|nr:transposase [Thermoanaerobaculia bacterium]
MTPTPEVRDAILGVLGRAQAKYGMVLHAPVFMSNHYHLLATIRDQKQMAEFMGYLNSNLAREIGRIVGWRDKFWSGRYSAIPVAPEEAAQVERLQYLLSHGAKEGLVLRAEDWPGVHPAKALLGEATLAGTWIDRTRAYEARRHRRGADLAPFSKRETVQLTPLPCWAHLSLEEQKARVRSLLAGIQEQAEAALRDRGTQPAGPEAIVRQNPLTRPATVKRSPAPLVHAATREVREWFRRAYREFTTAYRDASRRFRSGELGVPFPPGSFPPSAPWVPSLLDP